MAKKDLFKYQLICFIYISFHFFTLIFCVWTTKQIKTLFSICFLLIIIACIYINICIHFFFNIRIVYIINNVICYEITSFFLMLSEVIFLIVIFVTVILIKDYNYNNYETFLKNCPFTLTSEFPYENRKCELYNINKNSRYKYQYICSYDASDEFIDDKKTEDNFSQIICSLVENTVSSNTVINKFISEYNKGNNILFYCNRIDQPKKNEYINEEYCNKDINIPNIFSWLHELIYILCLFHIHYFTSIYKAITKRANYLLDEAYNNIDNNFDDNADSSTDDDESDSNDNIFVENNDKNIIIENNRIYNIKSNIKDYFVHKKN